VEITEEVIEETEEVIIEGEEGISITNDSIITDKFRTFAKLFGEGVLNPSFLRRESKLNLEIF